MADWFYSKDGQQLGPVSGADLKQLAASGQLLPDDMLWKEGMAQWAKASQVKGLFAGAGASAPAAAAFDVAPQPAPAQPQYPTQEYVASQYGSGTTAAPGTSGMAIASLVCGILFCVPFVSILAIIFGIIGIKQTGPGRRGGRGLAIAGLTIGCAMVLVNILSISILLPALNVARQQAQQIKSASNEKNIGLAIIMYENENKGQTPPDVITLAKAESLDPTVFVSPGSNDTPAPTISQLEAGGHNSYIYVGAGLTNPGMGTVLLYEKPGTFRNGSNVLFGDGSVQFVTNANLQSMLSGKNGK